MHFKCGQTAETLWNVPWSSRYAAIFFMPSRRSASGMNKLFRHFAKKRFLHRWHLLGVHLRALAALLSWVRADDRAAPHAHHASALQLDSMSGFEGPFPIIRLADQGNPNRTFPPWLFVVNTGLVTSLANATSNFASSSVCYSELRVKTRATTLQNHCGPLTFAIGPLRRVDLEIA